MKAILQCPKCKKYTLRDDCCEKTIIPLPPKYSPEDKYGSYRRKAKESERKEQGVL
jgi:H/ACA ribonucleoprotein complex subunit 3